MQEDSLLQAFDFAAIEEMDPSLADGHRIVFDREVPLELRIQDSSSGPQEIGSLEAIRVKVLLLGDDASPHHVKIEMTSENDIFYSYMHAVDDSAFRAMQESQKLMIDFAEYPSIIIRMLNSCVKEPHSFLAVFIMQRDGQARLDFIQNIEYKFIELLSCDFQAGSEETIRQQITYRYNAVKSRLALMQARLQDISALVKVKNPSLLLQLQRSSNSRSQRSVRGSAIH